MDARDTESYVLYSLDSEERLLKTFGRPLFGIDVEPDLRVDVAAELIHCVSLKLQVVSS